MNNENSKTDEGTTSDNEIKSDIERQEHQRAE
jgi:hypothetical protein